MVVNNFKASSHFYKTPLQIKCPPHGDFKNDSSSEADKDMQFGVVWERRRGVSRQHCPHCVWAGGEGPPLFSVLGQMPLSRYVRIRAWEGIQGFPINKHIDSNPARPAGHSLYILHIAYFIFTLYNTQSTVVERQRAQISWYRPSFGIEARAYAQSVLGSGASQLPGASPLPG